ncbi:hypothetical protein CsatB_025804 [Cannabis sativa]|uniref:Uncharacterized protein n=1 Tax=Cannabis sativa TaxID=3483 RepID=A0A803Q4V7_CANSA
MGNSHGGERSSYPHHQQTNLNNVIDYSQPKRKLLPTGPGVIDCNQAAQRYGGYVVSEYGGGRSGNNGEQNGLTKKQAAAQGYVPYYTK